MNAKRRRFPRSSAGSGAVAAVNAAALIDAPNVIAQPKIQWRMSTAWPAGSRPDAGLGTAIGEVVEETSGGRFRIEVFPRRPDPAGLGRFDAASKGTVEAFMASLRPYWARTEPAIEWFQTVPFGMNPEGMTAWYYQGDGLKLWEETYAPFDLVLRQGAAYAPQMAGWFRKKINTIADYKGLRMRIGAVPLGEQGRRPSRVAPRLSFRPPRSSPLAAEGNRRRRVGRTA